jgi:uncharacterized protein (DUF2336 family)
MALNPDLQAKLDSANEHYEALVASERDRSTYLLASMIADEDDPGRSIADLEKLGEEKLRQIVVWLNDQSRS